MSTRYSISNGERFGKLTILSYTDRVGKRGEYKCKCDCGNITYARTSALKSGKHTSCSCSRHLGRPDKRLPNNLAIIKALMKNYKRSALKRGHNFQLSIEEFSKLIESNCNYCGEIPQNSSNIGHLTNHYNYKYNGIDRVDNNIGYVSNNVVSCCPHCNMSKRALTVKEFKNWISKAYTNIFLKNFNDYPEGEYTQVSGNGGHPMKDDDIV